MGNERGLSLTELLVASTLSLFALLAVMTVYSQGNKLKHHVQGTAAIQNNVRLGMDRVQRDLRMIGFGVPGGARIADSSTWAPVIFYASSTGIGFRAEIDGGNAEIICTPKLSSTNCPLDRLRLDSIAYYKKFNCKDPATGSGKTKLIAVAPDGAWERYQCSGYSDSLTALTLDGNTPKDTFIGGSSRIATIEQVYLNYTASTQPPYGTLARQVRYDWAPSSTFPASNVTSQPIARQLSDFVLEYYDDSGTLLAGNPLDQTKREAIRTIVIFMEGYDQVGPGGHPQVVQMRSEIQIRNPAL